MISTNESAPLCYQNCSESHLDCPHPDVQEGEDYYIYLDGAQGDGKPLAAQFMSPGGSSASEDCFIFYYIFNVSQGLVGWSTF